MNVLIAHNSGFCDGVKRAMGIALAAADRHGGLEADGPLVHNDQAVELLTLRGVGAPRGDGGPVLVRAHGVPPERRAEWERAGREVVDATCVHVAANQRVAAEAAAAGETVILAGDPNHAEVMAVAASAGPGCAVVSSPEDIDRLDLPPDGGVLLLAQTTFNVELFGAMAEALRRHAPNCRVADTICRATHNRQEEAERLARRADALVVVGGAHSANTRRLADAGRRAGRPVFQVETAADLRPEDFASFRTAAVISGASTPGWVTQEVVGRLRGMGRTTTLSLLIGIVHQAAQSRLSLALSAFGLALAAQRFLLDGVVLADALAGACYVFFAHTLNRRVPGNPEARRLSHVDAYYQKRRPGLLTIAWLAGGLSLYLASREGAAVFALFAVALAAAALYALPAGGAGEKGKRTLPRHWPMAAGWAVVLAGPPALASGSIPAASGALTFIFLVCLGGTVVRDLHDIASDAIIGIDTLPARLGIGRARTLAYRCLGVAAGLPLLLVVLQNMITEGFGDRFFLGLVALSPLAGILLLDAMGRRRVNDPTLVQAGVDAMGVLAGVVAVAFTPGLWP